jgi:hypothetical protein
MRYVTCQGFIYPVVIMKLRMIRVVSKRVHFGKIGRKSSHRHLHRDPDFQDGGAGIEGRISTVGFLIKKLGLYCTGDVSGTGTCIGDFPIAGLLGRYFTSGS